MLPIKAEDPGIGRLRHESHRAIAHAEVGAAGMLAAGRAKIAVVHHLAAGGDEDAVVGHATGGEQGGAAADRPTVVGLRGRQLELRSVSRCNSPVMIVVAKPSLGSPKVVLTLTRPKMPQRIDSAVVGWRAW